MAGTSERRTAIKRSSRIIAAILVATAVLCTGIAAVAAETTNTIPPGQCLLTFSLKDETGGAFTDDVNVLLLAVEAGYGFKITSLDYLYGYTVAGAARQGFSYAIAVNYENKDAFTILNADGSTISHFTADSDTHVFDWVVIANEDAEAASETPKEADTGEDSVEDASDEDADKSEADEVLNAFIEAASVMENNSDFDMIINFYKRNVDMHAQRYAKYLNRAEDEFKALPLLEQFLWYELYVHPVMFTTFGNYSTNFETIGSWQHVTFPTHSFLSRCGSSGKAVADAYQTIMEWQYNYFIEHGAMYNFMTGKNSLEENAGVAAILRPNEALSDGDAPNEASNEPEAVRTSEPTTPNNLAGLNNDAQAVSPSESPGGGVGSTDETDEEAQELPEDEEIPEPIDGNEAQELPDGEGVTAEKDIWGKTIELLKDNILTLSILVVLAGGYAAVVIYRKRKAIDDAGSN